MTALDELIVATTDTCVEDPLRSTAKAAMRELAALRERVAKLEAALVKADELGVAAISATWPDLGDVPTSSQEWCKRFLRVKDASAAYRTAREATK